MKPYLDLLRDIRDNGRWSQNRTGIRTKKVVGRTMSFALMRGMTKILPMVTTRKIYFNPGMKELLWFLRGSTSQIELKFDGVGIWDAWANNGELGPIYGHQWRRFPAGEYFNNLTDDELIAYIDHMAADQTRMLQRENTLDGRRKELTDIGIDQISQALFLLKNRPNSRRIIITAWNPQVVPSDDISPQKNVELGRAALASCHCLAQFVTEELSEEERLELCPPVDSRSQAYKEGVVPSTLLNELNIPRFKLNCVMYQRKQYCAIAA